MNVLDLFSGIGGFSLGLEKAGMQTVAFCEINPYCQQVLAKHWPVFCYGDVKQVSRENIYHATGFGPFEIDVICGGFPCQDISLAGAGAGLSGKRSGLWFEFLRLIGEFRPRFAIIENVAALRSRGLATVLGGLASIGYDAEWHCIPAAAVGAPHRRDRIWVVAYPNGQPEREPRHETQTIGYQRDSRLVTGGCGDRQCIAGTIPDMAYADSAGLALRQGEPGYPRPKLTALERADWWVIEPDVGRVAHGIPARVDRLRALGNSIVPQIAEQIGRAIMGAVHADQG